MKPKFYAVLFLWVIGIAGAQAQVLRAFAPRYSNPSVKGNIVFVANNSITSSGAITTEAPPGGTAVNNNNPGVDLDVTAATIVPYGSVWKYFATGAAPAGAWKTFGYNDAAWPTGAGELGYGDGDEATCVPSGGGGSVCLPTGNKWITTYFRKRINIPNPLLYATYQFHVERDDGFVLYVNGTEVGRDNMPAGVPGNATAAVAAIEDGVVTINVPNTTFLVGNNDIVVEIHQSSATSSDISFNLELTGKTAGISNATTADLTLPSCTQVLFAGLYWGASQGVDGTNTAWITGETTVKLKIPGAGAYVNVTSTQTDYHNGTLVAGLPHTGYRCFANITPLINALSPNGTYTVANVVAAIGVNNASAGWTIVIAYSDPSTIVRNLTVFDGSAIMNGGDPALHIPITGFLTPPSGPVSCELGAVVFDGDRGQTDEFSFKQNSNPLVGTYTNLTANAAANLDDMWNSTISRYGVVVAARNPAHNNTLGYDADILVVPNAGNAVLGNSQNSASIRFSSPSENYMLQVATTAISQYTPSFNLSKSATDVNGGTLVPGDVIRYQLDYTNGGNDASTATTVIDNIPVGTSYKLNSLMISGVAKTDAMGDDEAEYDFTNNRVIFRLGTGANGSTGGEVASGVSGNVRFEVHSASSCAVFTCANTLSNRARIGYGGKLSGISLSDSSGVLVAGCNTPTSQSNLLTGSCRPMGDTLLVNVCPSLTVLLPYTRYAGYNFHTGLPITGANKYNPATPVTFTRTFYAYYDGPGSCDDTIVVNVFIIACPDIDDDNDGIPDYVELNNATALADANSNGIPNWNDPTYLGYVDFNADGFNDNFDPSADADNDGIPNFYDANVTGYVDSNGDGVNDNMDKDKDGIPNHLDLDSDNDGIPDAVESFGVDANGDGRIDNYTDTDNDGFSQNVDGGSAGVAGSGLGLGALDTDGDGVPNYLDKDSDNDGIPDVKESYGIDANNDGKEDSYSDTDADGYADIVDGDVGNDNVAENAAATLLRTSTDGNNDGRADTWPYANMEADSKANPYDLDSDQDGITDVREAQFPDINYDGRIDGAINSDGWNSGIAALGSLTLPNTDASGRPNVYDIDSDNDGIPDNVEGMPTSIYFLPSPTDTDLDGIGNAYDNFGGFGGDGIHPVDTDSDGIPDYYDTDTDSDGMPDLIEGNDLNFNGLTDDGIVLSGVDTDGDGLDNFFDNDNASPKGTSRYMGTGGTTLGQIPPGSITTVQHTSVVYGCATERDWRCLPYLLSCELITFKAVLQQQRVLVDWTVLCKQPVDHFEVERSLDRINFQPGFSLSARQVINESESYAGLDDINLVAADLIYYRLKTLTKNGKIIYSNIIAVRRNNKDEADVQVMPNPVKGSLQVLINTPVATLGQLHVLDASGKMVLKYTERLLAGNNSLTYPEAGDLPMGTYYLRVAIGEKIINKRFNLIK